MSSGDKTKKCPECGEDLKPVDPTVDCFSHKCPNSKCSVGSFRLNCTKNRGGAYKGCVPGITLAQLENNNGYSTRLNDKDFCIP